MNTKMSLTLLSLLAVAAHGSQFFASPEGDDANDGSKQAPFKTLSRVKKAIAEARKANPFESVDVVLAPGRFTLESTVVFTAEHGGREGVPVVIRAEKPGQTRISGSTDIPASAFHPVTDPDVMKRLDQQAAPHIVVADLAALGIPKQPAACSRKSGGVTILPELFFNDTRMTLARWPDTGWAEIKRIVDGGSKSNTGVVQANPAATAEKPRGGTFEYDGDRPARWRTAKDVWLRGYWCFDWSEEVIRASNIDVDKHQISLATQHVYGLRQGNPSPRRWYALNLLEELTAPGEFYLDADKQLLYFYPPSAIDGATIRLATAPNLMFSLDRLSDMVFQGIVFEEGMSCMQIANCRRVRVEGCTVRNFHFNGIAIIGGRENTIHSCDIHDMGTGGVASYAGDRKNLVPTRNVIENNHIRTFAVHRLTYSNAISLNGIEDVARHNLIHDAPHMAVSMSGNDNVFEYNIVHHVCLAADDSGALYKGRNPALRGNIVRYNLWHSIGKPMGHGVAAIYFDDGDGGESVIGNIFFRCGDPGRGSFGTVFSHGGHDIVAENNVFIECKRPLGSAPWNDKRWKEMIDGSLWQTRLLKDVDITRPPYTTRYPALIGFMTPQPGVPRVSFARRNLLLMCAEAKSGNWIVDDSNWMTDEDPGFVALNHGNFNFKPDAAVFTKIPGFQPINVDVMGLYANAWRPTVEKEPWTLSPPHPLPPLPKKEAPKPRIKTGPQPVLKVAKIVTPPSIDGNFAANEWNGLRPQDAIKLAANFDGQPASRPSQAWIFHDDEYLYIAVKNEIAPQTKLDGNAWGKDEAVEIALRPFDTASQGVHVIRGFANGYLFYGQSQDTANEPLGAEPSPCRFAASRLDETTWLAEFAIPFSKVSLPKGQPFKAKFSLTVHKGLDNLWLQAEPTLSNSYNVDNAFILEGE